MAHRESPHPTLQSPGTGARTPPFILIFQGNTFILDGAALPAIPTTDLYTRDTWGHPPDTSDRIVKVETRNPAGRLPAESRVFLGFPIQNGN